MKHILVTGVNGFVGTHLAHTLLGLGHKISGLTYGSGLPADNAKSLVSSYVCDLTDQKQVNNIDFSPYSVIINLAGLANVGQSFSDPDLYMRVNTLVLENLCEKLIRQGLSPRILAISTGAVYESRQVMPLKETSSLVEYGSPYAKSKMAMEEVANKYRTKGLPNCIVVRPFNHYGPGQKEGFIVPDLYKKLLASLRSGKTLLAGNLKTRRDYTDVRDVARAYALLATLPTKSLTSRLYNVCSGQTHSGEEILSELKVHTVGTKNLRVTTDPKLLRTSDPKVLFGSYELLHKDTGWTPRIIFEQTITDFVTSQKD